MSAGTLTLTNNSAAVTGSGTAFTTELAAGDFIVVTVGGIPYTLAIKTVNSNTSLTLVSSYTGPTQAGAAWYAVPRVAMNPSLRRWWPRAQNPARAQLRQTKLAEHFQRYRKRYGDPARRQQIYRACPNSFTQALNGKADKVNGSVPVNQGGTGATTAESARSNLGLGSASTLEATSSQTDATTGRSLRVGDWGIGNTTSVTKNIYADQHVENGFHQAPVQVAAVGLINLRPCLF